MSTRVGISFSCSCRRDLNTRRPSISLPVATLNLSAPLHVPKFVVLATVDPTLVFFYVYLSFLLPPRILRATQFLPPPRSSARGIFFCVPPLPCRTPLVGTALLFGRILIFFLSTIASTLFTVSFVTAVAFHGHSSSF